MLYVYTCLQELQDGEPITISGVSVLLDVETPELGGVTIVDGGR